MKEFKQVEKNDIEHRFQVFSMKKELRSGATHNMKGYIDHNIKC